MTQEERQSVIQLAEAAVTRGDYEQAESVVQQLLSELNRESLESESTASDKSLFANAKRILGIVSIRVADYAKALAHMDEALGTYQQLNDQLGLSKILGNIGLAYSCLSDYPRALEHYDRALDIAQELGDKTVEAIWLGNIGVVHWNLADFSKAIDYYVQSHRLAEELGNKVLEAAHLGNIGSVYWSLNNFEEALNYYTKALGITEESGDKPGAAVWISNIGSAYLKLGDYLKAREYLERGLSLNLSLGRKSEAGETLSYLGELYANLENPARDESKAIEYLLESISISEELGTKKFEAHKTLADLYQKQKRWEESHYHLGKYFVLKEEVQSEEARQKAQLMEQQKQIAEREKEIAIAKAAADARMSATTSLLYKVLPESVATRMIDGETEISDYFPQVSILFADIAGFTPISANMPAVIVVRFLNYVFGEFDRIIKRHGCEKIKTIGDGYMAVCGAPIQCEDHAERLAAAALEMQESIDLPESIREHMPPGLKLGVRIGLHTGSVVAGVIGEERFVYDLYSDAVNTAARMESHGEENRIHCSDAYYNHMINRVAMSPNNTATVEFEARGEILIKGKGTMSTYFLNKV